MVNNWENIIVGISGRFLKNKLYVSIQGEVLFAKSVTPYWTNNYGDTEYWRRNRLERFPCDIMIHVA